MRKSLFLVLVWYGFNSFAGNFEKNYGVGVIHISLAQPSLNIAIYKVPDSDKWFEMRFTNDETKAGMTEMKSDWPLDSILKYFQPEYFSYGAEKNRIDMYCIEQKGNWCKVFIDQVNHRTAWVKLNEKIKLSSWLEYYKTMASLEVTRYEDTKVLKEPLSKTVVMVIKKLSPGADDPNTVIRPLKISGYWMEVEIEQSGETHGNKKARGWIRWRDADKPLISYNIMGC